jgi:ribonucleotide monophosphatase NagD (HAD superfamily)
MVGDQLETDIAGARAAGLDAALLVGHATVSRAATESTAPTFVIDSLV